jgi:hypothetical protein
MASDAQIRANQANAARSKGPTSPEGKQASAANSLKHGLTAKKLIPERESEEIERRYIAFCEELQPSGEVGITLVRMAATMSVRAERCTEHENAMLMERVRKVEAEFVPPEGVDEATAARLLLEACKRALFDPSKEASLARKYEGAAQRAFFRALTELRRIEKAAKVDEEKKLDEQMGSFLSQEIMARKAELMAAADEDGEMSDEEFEDYYAQFMARHQAEASNRADLKGPGGQVDVPFAIGKPR